MLLLRQIAGEINCVSDGKNVPYVKIIALVKGVFTETCEGNDTPRRGICIWNGRVRLGDAKDKVISYRNRLTQECHYLHSCGWIFSHLDITQNLWAISWPFYLFAISSHTKKTKKKDCVPGGKTLYLSELLLVYKGFP